MRRRHRPSDQAPQRSIQWPVWFAVAFLALALNLVLHAPAQAGSASATLQVRARIVSSCAVSATALQSAGSASQGRFNCPVPSEFSSRPLSPAARGAAANYTITDLPDSDGNLKLLTLTF